MEKEKEIRRVGIVTENIRLGDGIVYYPFFKALKEHLPQATISLITPGLCLYRERFCGLLDEVVDNFDTSLSSFSIGDIRNILLRLMGNNKIDNNKNNGNDGEEAFDYYDVVLDTHSSLLKAYLTKKIMRCEIFLSIAAQGVLNTRSIRSTGGRYHSKYKHLKNPHIQDRLFAMLSYLFQKDIRSNSYNFPLITSKEIAQKAYKAVSSVNNRSDRPQDKAIIALCPGASHERKRWPLSKFVSLAKMQQSRGRSVVFILGPQEIYMQEFIRKNVQGVLFPEQDFIWNGCFSIFQTVAIFRHVHVIVTNDSGTAHLASLACKPIISLFGSSFRDENRWYPRTSAPFAKVSAHTLRLKHIDQIPVLCVARAVENYVGEQFF